MHAGAGFAGALLAAGTFRTGAELEAAAGATESGGIGAAETELLSIALAALVAAASIAPATRARADEIQSCASSYETAQKLRRKGELLAARRNLITCIRDVCPAFLRQDCAQWLDEVERAMPSIVVAAREASGRDRPDATITLDGVTVQMTDGKSVSLDPGTHTIQVETPDLPSVTERIVVREGEKNRRVSIALAKPAARQTPVLAYVLGGAGIAALGVGAGFGIKALSDRAELDDRQCKPSCPSGEVDAIRTGYWVSDISLGVGVLALGAALWLYVARPQTAEAPTRAQVRPSPGGLVLAF